MRIAKQLTKLFAAASILFSMTAASFALDWHLNDINSQKQISDGSTEVYVGNCYDEGNKKNVAIFFGRDLVFWLIRGSCVRVRNANIDISISGHLQNGDFANGTARRSD